MIVAKPHILYVKLCNNSAFEGKDLTVHHTIVLMFVQQKTMIVLSGCSVDLFGFIHYNKTS